MIFHSWNFLFFFLIVFFLVRYTNKVTWRNIILLLASLIFYSWSDWRYLFLIIGSALNDYIVGLKLEKKKSKATLFISIFCNLGILFFFKYYDDVLFKLYEWNLGSNLPFYNLVLPVGISFYTFQTMSYSIDVYRKAIPAEKSFFRLLLYVSFFPQLIAGPIERASRLLPQFDKIVRATNLEIKEGLLLIIIGLGKKLIIADRLGYYAQSAYTFEKEISSFALLLATYGHMFQFYFDFSAYSEMARGMAKCLGIKLMINFRAPLWSVTPSQFWTRWHISLMDWLRDYVFFPIVNTLGMNKISIFIGTFIVFSLSGIWHGGEFRYLVWGMLLGLVVAFSQLVRIQKKGMGRVEKFILWFFTFHHFAIIGVFMVSLDMNHALFILNKILQFESFELATMIEKVRIVSGEMILIIVFGAIYNWVDILKLKEDFLQRMAKIRFFEIILACLVFVILVFRFPLSDGEKPFLYFNF